MPKKSVDRQLKKIITDAISVGVNKDDIFFGSAVSNESDLSIDNLRNGIRKYF